MSSVRFVDGWSSFLVYYMIWRIEEDPTGVVKESVRELQDLISDECKTVIQLRSSLERMREILKSLDSVLTNMLSAGLKLDLPMADILAFLSVVRESRSLILTYRCWGKVVSAKKVKELEDSMLKFYLVDLRHLVVAKMRALQLDSKVDASLPSREIIPSPNRSGSQLDMSHLSFALGGKEKLQGIVVGPHHPVVEVKGLMKELCTSPLVISAPPGHGKTTLVENVCEDAAIREEYGDCVFFLHVSATPNVVALISKLSEDINRSQCDKIPSGTTEIRELGNFVKSSRITRMLLVLDDVWCEWEFLIDEFNFQIPGYKLLVTSRFRFPRFDGYELTRLCQNDEQPLYFQSGKCHSDPNDNHVNQVDLIPSELPVLMWKRTPKNNSTEGKPVYVENVEGMTKTVGLFDKFEMEDSDAFVLPSNYLESRIMGD